MRPRSQERCRQIEQPPRSTVSKADDSMCPLESWPYSAADIFIRRGAGNHLSLSNCAPFHMSARSSDEQLKHFSHRRPVNLKLQTRILVHLIKAVFVENEPIFTQAWTTCQQMHTTYQSNFSK